MVLVMLSFAQQGALSDKKCNRSESPTYSNFLAGARLTHFLTSSSSPAHRPPQEHLLQYPATRLQQPSEQIH